MRMDTRIPLQVQGPDIMGAIDRGTQAASNYNALRQQNALADIYRTQGAGIMAGDPAALNALAGMDPQAALGIQSTRQNMQFDAETMQMRRDEAKRAVEADVAKMTAEQRATEAAALERGLTAAGMAYKSGDRAAYNEIITGFGMDPAQLPFDQFPAHAAQYSGVLDALKNAGEVFAPPPSVDPTKGAPSGYMFTDPQNPAAGVAPLPGYTPKSPVQVNVGGGDNKQIYDTMEKSREAAQSATVGLASLSEAKKALKDGAITGAFADQRLGLQKIAALIGAGDTAAIQNTETFRAAIAPQVAAIMKATVGSTQISNADREFAERAAGGSIALDAGTIARLLDVMERAGKVAISLHNEKLDRVYPEGQGFDRERAVFGVQPSAIQQPAGGATTISDDDLLRMYGGE